MTRIRGKVQDGVIVPNEPIDWPDNTEVEVSAVEKDNEKPDSPEEIEMQIAAWDAIPTPVMSDEEWAAWDQRRKEDREYEARMAPIREERLRKSIEGE